MCGRFTRFTPAADIAKAFSAVAAPVEMRPSYNIAPTQSIYVVKETDFGERKSFVETTVLF